MMLEVWTKQKTIQIQGVRRHTSREFCILPVYIVCIYSCGGVKEKAKIKKCVEFHIINNLNDSFVIRMDVTAPYQIDIITSKGDARICTCGAQDIPFLIHFGKAMSRRLLQDSYSVISAQTTTIPLRCKMVIRVMMATPEGTVPHNVFVDPIPLVNTAQGFHSVVGKGVYTSKTTHVCFANMGRQSITLKRGTKIATAVHLSSTDTVSATKIRYKLGGKAPAIIILAL
jgi:hypothetical protein